MNIPRRALATLLYGLGSSLVFMPLVWAASHVLRWPQTWTLAIWSITIPYGFILGAWNRRPGAAVFPLLVMLPAVFWNGSQPIFLATWLLVIGWLRTGLSDSGSLILKSVAEIILGLGFLGLVTWVAPRGTISGALTLWAFFLIQAIYFVIFPEIIPAEETEGLIDPFERARSKAEAILTDRR